MNIKVQPKIHNRFDIYKKNVVTGEEKQVGYAENIVLDSMWSRLCSGSTYFVNIHYGVNAVFRIDFKVRDMRATGKSTATH